MKTYLDCIPCFFRQILEGSRLTGASLKVQKKVIDEFAKIIPEVPLKFPPPQIARLGYGILRDISPDGDPYKKIKQKSNQFALKLYGKLKNKVSRSKDRILIALELAIAGNIIDFGVKNNLDVNKELNDILAREDKQQRRKSVFHYKEFRESLKEADTILYLADNAGEIVFDRVLIEEIKRVFPDKVIYFAVKDKPAINDALIEDAVYCGLDKVTKVISNGSDAPGTVLRLCSAEFRKIYRKADMVISKGQGNFESLSEQARPIFFLFMVKCPVVANEVHCRLGDIILADNRLI